MQRKNNMKKGASEKSFWNVPFTVEERFFRQKSLKKSYTNIYSCSILYLQ